jgi:hypothetical protein
MTAVMRRCALLIVLLIFVLVGCASDRDRQWYKPNVNYTVEQF